MSEKQIQDTLHDAKRVARAGNVAQWRAECACGWEGLWRLNIGRANEDGREHNQLNAALAEAHDAQESQSVIQATYSDSEIEHTIRRAEKDFGGNSRIVRVLQSLYRYDQKAKTLLDELRDEMPEHVYLQLLSVIGGPR